MTEQQWIDLARAWLAQDVDCGSRLRDDGHEAEKLALAFGTGIEINSGGETWLPSPDHVRPGDANYRFAREALERDELTFTGDLDPLIELARIDKVAHDACELIFRTLAEQRRPIPPPLALQVAEAKRPLKGAHKNKPRDHAIVRAVSALVAEGLKPTRNEVSPPISACDYVALVLRQDYGAKTKYEAVRKVWDAAPLWEKVIP